MNLLSVVPARYRLLSIALLAAALLGFGWVKGASHVQSEWDAAISKQTLQVAVVKQRQAEATVKVITKYVDRVKIVREAGATIIKEVPVYVSPEADAACVLSRGFVRLHDAAAAGIVPEPTGAVDAAPAGITLSTVAGTVADNYSRCYENSAQLEAIQDWVRQMQKDSE